MTAPTRSISKRVAGATLAVATAAGIGIAAAGPAAAGYSYRLHAGTDYSSAQIWLNGGTWGRAGALHGNLYPVSNWYNAYAYAYADSGWSTRYAAWVQHT